MKNREQSTANWESLYTTALLELIVRHFFPKQWWRTQL